jgi:predicted acylesterase/phospholipase RssA
VRNQCDLAIEPELEDSRRDDFGRASGLIAAGEMAARKTLPALRKPLRSERRKK